MSARHGVADTEEFGQREGVAAAKEFRQKESVAATKKIRKRAVFILRPTNVRIWHKAVFKVGPVAGPKPNTRGSSKNASDPVGIPLFGAPQAPGDKPNPSEEG